ncbi:hypothetical protein SNE40_002460 [Patella caerulea]|uniref:2'-phosphotransferase n=1 Tax=Patella caerulea TaxID=87958 RepID=A0AAN8PZ75_PATCE
MSDTSARPTGGNHLSKEEVALRLSKRLCYILRYGAVKSGLHVNEHGFVPVEELIKLPMLKWHSKEEILQELSTSISTRNVNRFELLEQNGEILARAVYARNFEKAPVSTENQESQIDSLYDVCLQKIMDNLNDYDLSDFQDEHTIRIMIYRLKSQKKLNMKGLKVLLVPTLENLDFEGLYLTENIFKLMWNNCPNLKELSLKNCGYIVTDTILIQILKKLPKIEILNVAFCNHLTDKTLETIVKYIPQIKELNLNKINNFSEEAIIKFLSSTHKLKRLDVYNLRTTEQGRVKILQYIRSHGIKFICRGFENEDVAPEMPAYL